MRPSKQIYLLGDGSWRWNKGFKGNCSSLRGLARFKEERTSVELLHVAGVRAVNSANLSIDPLLHLRNLVDAVRNLESLQLRNNSSSFDVFIEVD